MCEVSVKKVYICTLLGENATFARLQMYKKTNNII